MHRFPLLVVLLLLFFLNAFSDSSNNPSNLKTQVSINCGSIGPSASVNGREWIGDVQPESSSSLLQVKGSSTTSAVIQSLTSADQVPHKTARISVSQFSYTFQVSPGQKIIRLHFNPATYKGCKGFKDLFTVEAGPFTLLTNFTAKTSFAKEFCISIEENQTLTITFSPVEGAYAFINGIEIIPLPSHLSYFKGGAQVVGQKSLVYIDNTTLLELVLDSVSSTDDMLGMLETSPKLKENQTNNLTWRIPVDVGFNYLLRIHFTNLGLKKAETDGLIFELLIDEIIVDTNAEILGERVDRRDYIVAVEGRKQDSKRDLLISLQSYDEFIGGYKLVKGFEIFKLRNTDNSLASPNALPCVRDLPSWIIQNPLSFLGPRNAIATVVVTIIAVLNILVHKLREFWDASSVEEENKPSVRAERLYRRFSLYEIQSATKDFNSGLIIGRGGFGKVYKGHIDKGQKTVAVKRLKSYSMQGGHEFLTEIETLCELRHVNLVSLIGYCNEQREMILVYDYMAGGTLGGHLYKLPKQKNNVSCLNWKQRLNICIGAGRGLEYLHTGHGIIHRDVKPSNILLDENFVAKVSDFGLAKLEDRTASQTHVSTKVKGTRGYLDPHYINTCNLTRKSDTYSFGVLLLEVLCGRAVVDTGADEDARYLPWWVRGKISQGKVDEIVDSSLREGISPDSLKVFVEVAERCLHDEPKKRPTMSQVVVELEFALEQQETRNFAHTSPYTNDVCQSNEDIVSSESPEQTKEASTYVQAVTYPTKQSNLNYSLIGKEGRRKPKNHSPLRFGALWNRIKPFTINEFSIISDKSLPKFTLTSIETATNRFSSPLNIGCGETFSMYMAVLPTGRIVAVKRFSKSSLALNEFKNEILLVSRLDHQNIIKQLGYCVHEQGKMILVYDYMANGTLRSHLYEDLQKAPLTWEQRLRICIGAARGLHYLHAGADHPTIHCCVNSNNILLDEKWVPKISNFGHSRALGSDTHSSAMVRGTLGYLDPEYINSGQLTEKCDVYSFGVVLFEVLCGMPAVIHTELGEPRSLAQCVKIHYKEGTLDEEIIDPNLKGQIAAACLSTFVETAIACISLRATERPAMSDIVSSLEFAMQLQVAAKRSMVDEEMFSRSAELLTARR